MSIIFNKLTFIADYIEKLIIALEYNKDLKQQYTTMSA